MRSVVPIVFLTLWVAAFGAVVWLTRHPEAEILREAESWPVVGPAAAGFRELYLPPARVEPEAPEADLAGIESPPPTEVRHAIRDAAVGDLLWILPGTPLLQEPDGRSRERLRFDSVTNVVELERRGDWFYIDWRGVRGWVYLEDYVEEGGPPYGMAALPPGPLPGLPAQEDLLDKARALFFGRESVTALGPYTLYTNSTDRALLQRLGAVAARLEEQYAARYGREPVGEPKESIVLYRSEAPYRLLQAEDPVLLGLHSSGHNTAGLVVFYIGERSHHEVTATLVHELAHLLNRRALGPALPPFLDEGIADDLAMASWSEDGVMDPSSFSGEIERSADSVAAAGGLSTLWHLRDLDQRRELLRLWDVVHLDWDSFVRSEQITVHYGVSALWVRHLLAHPHSAAVFRRFLEEVAAGGPPDPERIRRGLDTTWPRLDAELRAAIRTWAEEAELPSSTGIIFQR